jgi:hypothetical protein
VTTQDQARFEEWLEHWATPEERALPYEKQLEAHICYLAGLNGTFEILERMEITKDDLPN